ADEQSVRAKTDVVPRLIEGAAAAGRELHDAGERRRFRKRERRDALDRYATAVGVERIGRVPPALRRAGDGAAVLLDLDPVEPYASAVEPQRRGRFLKRLAVGRAAVDRHAAEADGPLVLAGEVEVSRQEAVDRIVVELKRVTQAVDVAPHD